MKNTLELIITFLLIVILIFFTLVVITIVRRGFQLYWSDMYWNIRKNICFKSVQAIRKRYARCKTVKQINMLEARFTKKQEFLQSFVPEEHIPPITIDDMDVLNSILASIDAAIALEINDVLLLQSVETLRIDPLNLDKYMHQVSTAVFEGLNDTLYSTSLLFNTTYIHTYILKKSKILLLSIITEHNKSLPR